MENTKHEIKNTQHESRPSRPSFRDAFSRAARQVELYECTSANEREPIRELCYIIAEVYILDPDSKIKISDEHLDAYLVQEIFGNLTLEHLRMVLHNFQDKVELIKNKRAYLRSALYNSFFEFEAHYINLVRHDLGCGGVR